METSNAVEYVVNGIPESVLNFTSVPLCPMNNDRVCVRMSAAPVHPSDFGLIEGRYGRKTPLPAIAGREGVGRVVEVGKKVRALREGTLVRIPESYGTWREFVVVDAAEIEIVDVDIPEEMAAMSFINPPTAWRLLHDFVPLKPGDWIVQNAATSAVGLSVIQLARHFGINTLNFVRHPEAKEFLQAYGATVVLCGDECRHFVDFTHGVRPQLGLNSVGGESVLLLTKCVGDNGVIVTFGGMTDEKLRFPTRYLIFNNIQFRGFWMDRWSRERPKEEVRDCYRQIFNLVKARKITLPVVGRYRLQDWREAIQHARSENRRGKIIFTYVGQQGSSL
jgi:trans-2-enoyl-CoA reductase